MVLLSVVVAVAASSFTFANAAPEFALLPLNVLLKIWAVAVLPSRATLRIPPPLPAFAVFPLKVELVTARVDSPRTVGPRLDRGIGMCTVGANQRQRGVASVRA